MLIILFRQLSFCDYISIIHTDKLTLVTKFLKRYQLCVLCNNKPLLPSMDVNNPLKAITVLLYRTTDQGLGI
jgi:hypothetical protein